MRLHVTERAIARYVRGVTVDGEYVPNCVEADEEAGWARFILSTPDEADPAVSHTELDGDGNAITYVLCGTVRLLIDFTPDA